MPLSKFHLQLSRMKFASPQIAEKAWNQLSKTSLWCHYWSLNASCRASVRWVKFPLGKNLEFRCWCRESLLQHTDLGLWRFAGVLISKGQLLNCFLIIGIPVFTTRCYASAGLAMGLCPCLSVYVTSRCSTKTAKRRITQTTPHHTPGTLVFWCQRSQRNSTGVTPYDGAECRWGGQNWRLSTNNRLYLENGKQ